MATAADLTVALPEVSNEFRKYVDAKVNKLKRDNFTGNYTFKFAFRKFQRVWVHKYVKEVHKLRSETIGPKGAKKIIIFKPNFRSLTYGIKFNQSLIHLLKHCTNIFTFQTDSDLTYYTSDFNKFISVVDCSALQDAKPILAQFKVNPDLVSWRKQLPIWDHRETIMTHIVTHQVVIITGGPGIGKSTQIPQYILEYMASCAMPSRTICVLPYSLATMVTAKRVALERGESIGNTIGYRVPNRSEHLPDSPLIFCTSEILLRTMVNGDPFFEKTTHVVVDNIDVRDKYTDLVLLCLRECLITYPKLRLVLISGSADNHLFVEYFNGAPVVKIPSQNTDTSNVQEYFLEDMYRVTNHKPRQQEILRLLPDYPLLRRCNKSVIEDPKNDSIDLELIIELILYICLNKPVGAILVYLPSFEDIKQVQELIIVHKDFQNIKYDLFFLHRMINISTQRYIFNTLSSRKIILGTALAESTFFINDIYYVIDVGKIRNLGFVAGNCLSHVSMLWITKESAKRRSSRFGKNENGPVECYRMYTQREYQRMLPINMAEILTAPITDLCLLSRKIAPADISLKEFFNRCIQTPAEAAIDFSVNYLKTIGALESNEALTPWGNIMGQLPLEPRLTKMIMYALAFGCIEPMVTIVSFISLRGPCALPALSEDQPFLANRLRQFSQDLYSDHLALIKLFAAWHTAKINGEKNEFCTKNFLRGGFMELVVLKRNDLLIHLHGCAYLHNLPSIGVEERNQQGNSWSVIKACLTAGLSPQFACVDKSAWKLSNNLHDHLDIGSESTCYREIKNLPSDWLIYESCAPLKIIKNITCINPLTLLLFGTNAPWEMKKYDPSTGGLTHMSLFLLNSWAQFSDSYSSLSGIRQLKKSIEHHMLFYITVPNRFPGSDADKTLRLISNGLRIEDILSRVLLPVGLGAKPAFSRTRINFAKQPFDNGNCECVDCPDEIYFRPIVTEYQRYISPVLQEQAANCSQLTEEEDIAIQQLLSLKICNTPRE